VDCPKNPVSGQQPIKTMDHIIITYNFISYKLFFCFLMEAVSKPTGFENISIERRGIAVLFTLPP
jgi:hypothetical protein